MASGYVVDYSSCIAVSHPGIVEILYPYNIACRNSGNLCCCRFYTIYAENNITAS